MLEVQFLPVAWVMVIGWVVMLFLLLGRLAFGPTFYQQHSAMVLRQGGIVGKGHLGPVHGKS